MRNRNYRAGLALASSLIAWAGAAKAGETVVYRYDSLGRLIGVERSGSVNNGVKADYSYDPADNRTRVAVSGVPMVVGGSFESPEVGAGYKYAPADGPADFTDHSGITGNGSVWGFAAAPDGDQVAFVQSYGKASTIRLTVKGLTPGATYTVRFSIAVRPGYGSNPVTADFNGTALGTFTPGSTAFAAVTSAAFTATAESGKLTFTGSDSPADLGTGLDRVTIAPAGGN